MEPNILTVSQLNRYVKSLLEGDFRLRDLYLRGEISNFKEHHQSGHLYFSLKEGDSAVRAVMFASNARLLRFRPENGLSVIVRCSAALYERDGSFQVYVYELLPEGKGALQLAFEQLYRKLEQRGCFAQGRKRPLPPFPQRIGVVTSESGAALQDIRSVLERRYPLATLVLWPALVQGEGAVDSIVEGIAEMNRQQACDVLIVGRGGGSLEDLWAFNEEQVVEAICHSGIPVISAVGHETDTTLSDFAADLRAPTPTAAAELATPDLAEIAGALSSYQLQMRRGMQELLFSQRQRLESLERRQCFQNFQHYLDKDTKRLESLQNSIGNAAKNVILYKKDRLRSRIAVVEALSPIRRLAEGYSIAISHTGESLRSVQQVQVGEQLTTRLADGSLISRVEEIRPGAVDSRWPIPSTERK